MLKVATADGPYGQKPLRSALAVAGQTPAVINVNFFWKMSIFALGNVMDFFVCYQGYLPNGAKIIKKNLQKSPPDF